MCKKKIYIDDIIGAGGYEYIKKIYIKFIKTSNKFSNYNSLSDLNGLLKLCLLSEISSKLDLEQIKQMPEIIYYIMKILKNGYIETIRDTKKNIKEVLEKVKGSNVINFSNFVEEEINLTDIKTMINFLDNNHKTEIKDINYRLSKYNKYIKLFDKEFEKSRKESIFEFSVVSLVIIEREDFEKFEKEREKCPNRVEKILYHGTQIEPISCILTGLFKNSVDRCYQHGKGVYFTDLLDYCWFYGGSENNRGNKNKIPKVGEEFTLIACSVYYDQKGFMKVKNYRTRI